jgi:hypothetical protein
MTKSYPVAKHRWLWHVDKPAFNDVYHRNESLQKNWALRLKQFS